MPEIINRDEGRSLFGLNPQGYDDSRPDYPAWIFDRLRESGALIDGTPTLEIGAGPGKATRRLLEYGADPLTIIEPDDRFTAILETISSVSAADCRIICQSFENAVLADHQFGLVAAATVFHWIDAIPGLCKVRRLLKSNGFAALFWNVMQDSDKEDLFHNATHELLSTLAVTPYGTHGTVPYPLDRQAREAEAVAAGFKNIEYLESRWAIELTTLQIGKLYESFSHIQRLDEGSRGKILSKLMNIAESQFNGKVVKNVTSCLYLLS